MTSVSAGTQSRPSAQPEFALSVETLAIAAIVISAVLLRGIGLGDTPLSPSEAPQAVAAAGLAPKPRGGGQIDSVLVFGGAALSFALATPTAAAARFLPMAAGIALALLPLMFRSYLGRAPTVLAALLLAISPTAVAMSRQMSGVGLSMLAALLAIKALEWHLSTRNPYAFMACGGALGASLLADFGSALIILATAIGFGFALLTDEEGVLTKETVGATWQSLPWPLFFVGLIGTLLAFGTLFFVAPHGLGAAADQIGRLFSGLVYRPVDAPYLGVVLAAYEPLLLVLGLPGAWIASQSSSPALRALAGWGVAATLLSLVYPGAVPAHSLWSVVPLAALSAITLDRLTRIEHDAPRWAIWTHALAVAGAMAMIVNRLSHQLRAPMSIQILPPIAPGQPDISIQLDIIWIGIGLALLVLFWLVVANFWEPNAALQGAGLGLALPGLLVTLGSAGSLAFARAASPFELVTISPAQDGVTRLVQTAQEISEIAVGNRRDATVTIQGESDGVLAWAFQRYTHVEFVERPTPNIQSVMVITPADGSSPFLGSNYVGQDFVIVSRWDVTSLDAGQALLWMLYRRADPATVRHERVILWVREDVYKLAPQGSAP